MPRLAIAFSLDEAKANFAETWRAWLARTSSHL